MRRLRPEARRLVEKPEIHYTPKHGSWLNMAEIEPSILSRQRLDHRIGKQAQLKREVTAWQAKRNAQFACINCRFTTADARISCILPWRMIHPSNDDGHTTSETFLSLAASRLMLSRCVPLYSVIFHVQTLS